MGEFELDESYLGTGRVRGKRGTRSSWKKTCFWCINIDKRITAMLNREEILEYLRTEIKPHLDEDGVINLGLFDSVARNEMNENSDIDICLERTDLFRKKIFSI